MVVRDIKSRYAGSILGILWSVLHPAALIFTYYFVFSVVLKIRLGPEFDDANFTVWLISGLLPWIFFSDVLSRSSSVIVNNRNLITKTQFPSEILPLITLISGLTNHLITISLFMLIATCVSAISPSFSMLLILPYTIITCIFALGLAWIISSINVYLRDIEQLIGILLNLWFYFTPIIYPISSVPEKYINLLKINPLFHISDGYRMILLNKLDLLSINGLSYIFVVSIAVLGLGGIIFKKLKGGFGDIL